MVSSETFRQLALSFDGTEQAPHFNRTAFKITGRKIFATLLEEANAANMLLPPEEQGLYTTYNEAAVYPVPNKWGSQGWTTFELSYLPTKLVSDALMVAHRYVLQQAPAKKKRR